MGVDGRSFSSLRAENCREAKGDDLPDEIALKVLRIFPDYGAMGESYLSDLNGVGICVEEVGGSPDLAARFEAWSRRWDETSTANDYQTDHDLSPGRAASVL